MDRYLATVAHPGGEVQAGMVLVEQDGKVVDANTGEVIDVEGVASALADVGGSLRRLRDVLVREIKAAGDPLSGKVSWSRKGGAGWVAYVGQQSIAEAVSRADLRQELSHLGLDLEWFPEVALRVVKVS